MALSQESNNKGQQYSGAYSAQFQVMEQERLRRLQEEHFQSTITMRSRAQVLSKQTIQRKRALEQKKQAMAKAEEERRRKALEERRRTQQEATDRFRNAIYRNFRPLSTTSVPTTKSLKINPSTENIHRINSAAENLYMKLNKIKPPSSITTNTTNTSSHPQLLSSSANREDHKTPLSKGTHHFIPSSLGHTTHEPITTSLTTTTTTTTGVSTALHGQPITSTPVPNLDEVLDTIRGERVRKREGEGQLSDTKSAGNTCTCNGVSRVPERKRKERVEGNKRHQISSPPPSHNDEDSLLSPIHLQPSFIIDTPPNNNISSDQTTPTKALFHTPPLDQSPAPPSPPQTTPTNDIVEEISSTSSSLHDSLDTPPLSPKATPNSTPPLESHQVLDLSKVVIPSPETTPITTPPQLEEKRLVGILKKPTPQTTIIDSSLSYSTINGSSTSTIFSRGSSSKSSHNSAGKRVRFVDEYINGKNNKKSTPKTITHDGFMVVGGVASPHYHTHSPKVRISLNSHSQTQKLTGSNNNNKIHHRNGLTSKNPPPTQDNEPKNHTHSIEARPISPQLLTFPIDKTILERTPTDEEINELWQHINSYLHHTKITSSEDTPITREVSAPPLVRSIRCRNSHQPVKLWRRHASSSSPVGGQQQQQQQFEEPPKKAMSVPMLNDEEHRLMESIEVLNEKLKGRVTSTETLEGTTSEIKKSHSSRSINDLPRTRVRYHPKTILQTTPISSRQILQYNQL